MGKGKATDFTASSTANSNVAQGVGAGDVRSPEFISAIWDLDQFRAPLNYLVNTGLYDFYSLLLFLSGWFAFTLVLIAIQRDDLALKELLSNSSAINPDLIQVNNASVPIIVGITEFILRFGFAKGLYRLGGAIAFGSGEIVFQVFTRVISCARAIIKRSAEQLPARHPSGWKRMDLISLIAQHSPQVSFDLVTDVSSQLLDSDLPRSKHI
jgi:hypothetical protein